MPEKTYDFEYVVELLQTQEAEFHAQNQAQNQLILEVSQAQFLALEALNTHNEEIEALKAQNLALAEEIEALKAQILALVEHNTKVSAVLDVIEENTEITKDVLLNAKDVLPSKKKGFRRLFA